MSYGDFSYHQLQAEWQAAAEKNDRYKELLSDILILLEGGETAANVVAQIHTEQKKLGL